MTLTRSQRANLRKLADYLESLPENYAHFEMGKWMALDGADPRVVEYVRHNGGVAQCGTVACAVGHGPAAGVLFRKTELWEDGSPQWWNYSRRFASDADDGFSWCFHSWWRAHDNHHYGAAARIRYLLKHGKAPEWFNAPGGRWLDAYRPFDKRYAEVPA